jgi:hypothetical protein
MTTYSSYMQDKSASLIRAKLLQGIPFSAHEADFAERLATRFTKSKLNAAGAGGGNVTATFNHELSSPRLDVDVEHTRRAGFPGFRKDVPVNNMNFSVTGHPEGATGVMTHNVGELGDKTRIAANDTMRAFGAGSVQRQAYGSSMGHVPVQSPAVIRDMARPLQGGTAASVRAVAGKSYAGVGA